jgi:hypothetical protein
MGEAIKFDGEAFQLADVDKRSRYFREWIVRCTGGIPTCILHRSDAEMGY